MRPRRLDFCSCSVSIHRTTGFSHAGKQTPDDCLTNQNATFLDLLSRSDAEADAAQTSHPTFKYPASRVPHDRSISSLRGLHPEEYR